MKKNWQVVTIGVALSIIFGVSGVLAQTPPIAGGYAETSSSDPEVVSAARFAISTQAQKQGAHISLVSIERAEVQVVAGLNYRLHLKVKVNGQIEDVTTVVYRNLKNKYSLTNWEVEGNHAGSASSSDSTIEQLVKEMADAFTAKELGKLDAGRSLMGRVRIVIEHSLAEDDAKDRFEVRTFRTFAKAEQWLKSREIRDYGPARQSMPLVRCRKGVCTYNFDGGILHNNLYIKRVTYGFRSGRPYIKTIYLLDGD